MENQVPTPIPVSASRKTFVPILVGVFALLTFGILFYLLKPFPIKNLPGKNTTTLHPVTTSATDWKIYKNLLPRYTLQYPSTWQAGQIQNIQNNSSQLILKPPNSDPILSPNIILSIESESVSKTIASTSAAIGQHSPQQILIDGISGTKETWKDNNNVQQVYFVFHNQNFVYTFHTYGESIPVLTTVVGTLKFGSPKELDTEVQTSLRNYASTINTYAFYRKKFPKSLDDLIPQYISKIPTNPIDNKPFVYILKSDLSGFTLSGVMTDGKEYIVDSKDVKKR